MLHSFTTAVNLFALMAALWLGLYLITRSHQRQVTWLAALTLWSMGGYFLNQLLALNPPPAPPEETRDWLHHLILFWPRDVFELGWQGWLQGWLPSYSVVFWYHATLAMLPGDFNRRRLIMAGAGYACALAGILVKVRYSSYWINPGNNPLYSSSLNIPLFPIFGIGFATFAGLSALNLLNAMRASPEAMPHVQFRLFMLATILGGITGFAGIFSHLLGKPVPQALIALILLAALLLTGIGVARYNALLDRKPLQRDFIYSAAEAGAILVIYLFFHRLFTELYPLPPISFVFVGCLAVITHLLIDFTRHQLDRVFLHDKNRQLRLRLRQLSKLAGNRENTEIFREALGMIGASVAATWLFSLRFTKEGLKPVSTWNWAGESPEQAVTCVPAGDLVVEEPIVLKSRRLPPPFEQTAVIVPLSDYEQSGALLVGPSKSQADYSEIELVTLLDAGEILAKLLADLYPATEAHLKKATLYTGFGPAHMNAETLPRLVELGLRNLHDYAYLSDSPLAKLHLVERSLPGEITTHIDRGKAVSAVLEEAVTHLRPDMDEPCGTLPRTWYPYIILRDAYLDGEPNREIMSRLYISEGTFNRTRKAAIRSIARLISEMEAGLD